MSDKKKKTKKNTASVLSQQGTNMKFIDFAELGKDAAELGHKYARRKIREKRNKKD